MKQKAKERREANNVSIRGDKVQKETIQYSNSGNKYPGSKKGLQQTSSVVYDGSFASFLRLKQQRQKNEQSQQHEKTNLQADDTTPNEVMIDRNVNEKSSEIGKNTNLSNSVVSGSVCKTNTIAPQQKNTRGLTMLKDVQTRSLDQRKNIILNDKNQPVGPDQNTMKEFSSFLGTVSRRANLAPLNYCDWRLVPNKHLIWEFVNTKYIVPEEGKRWVLKAVGDCWRTYKHRTKEKFYDKYHTDEERKQNRPKYITENVFNVLLQYWNDKDVQTMAKVNAEVRQNVKDNPMAGPMSFARLYHNAEARIEELRAQEQNEQNNLLADEVVGDLTLPKSGYVRLYGRGVRATDLKEKTTSTELSYKVPSACIDAIKSSLEEEMQQKLAEEKALMEKKLLEKDQQLEHKLQAQNAVWQKMFSTFLKQFGEDNSQLNIDNSKLQTLMVNQSHGDESNDTRQTVDQEENRYVRR